MSSYKCIVPLVMTEKKHKTFNKASGLHTGKSVWGNLSFQSIKSYDLINLYKHIIQCADRRAQHYTPHLCTASGWMSCYTTKGTVADTTHSALHIVTLTWQTVSPSFHTAENGLAQLRCSGNNVLLT